MENYIRELDRAHIILSEQEDSLVWDADAGGAYTPKAGYLFLSAGVVLKGRSLVVEAIVEA